MLVCKLRTKNFRNLCHQEIDLSANCILLHGDNGQGKTSLLEAVFLLSSGKSFRAGRIKDLVNNNCAQNSSSTGFDVEGEIRSFGLEKTVGISLTNGKRHVFVNGNQLRSATQFFGQFCVVCFTAEDLLLVRGSPGIRRQFVDRLLSQVDHQYLEYLVRYHKALKHRQAVLTDSRLANKETLIYWDKIIADTAEPISQARMNFIRELSNKASDYYRDLLGMAEITAQEGIKLSYRSDLLQDDLLLKSSSFADNLLAYHSKDLARGTTSLGIHRDDMEINLKTEFAEFSLAKNLASQGQCRTIAIALVLGAVDVLTELLGEAPVILLDDVESELDENRLRGLYKLLKKFHSQVIVTSTHISRSLVEQMADVEVLKIAGGRVQK